MERLYITCYRADDRTGVATTPSPFDPMKDPLTDPGWQSVVHKVVLSVTAAEAAIVDRKRRETGGGRGIN